jgi:hypothetical protein
MAGIPNFRNNDFLESRVRNYALRAAIVAQVEGLIGRAGGRSEKCDGPYTLKINGDVKVSVRVIRCSHELRYNYYRWRLPAHMANDVDFVLAAQLDTANIAILRYYLLSSSQFIDGNIAFTEKSATRYAIFARENLSDFFGLPS